MTPKGKSITSLNTHPPMLAFEIVPTRAPKLPPTIPLVKGLLSVTLRLPKDADGATGVCPDVAQPWLLVVLVVVLVNAWALAAVVLVARV